MFLLLLLKIKFIYLNNLISRMINNNFKYNSRNIRDRFSKEKYQIILMLLYG